MAMNLSSNGGITPVINVTPMIDVLLVLIIIFMLIQPKHKHGLPTEVPQDSTSTSTPTPIATIVLEITNGANNEPVIRINATEVPHAELEARLRDIYKSRQEKIMFVKGDAKLDFLNVADVIDIARAADPDIRVGLITRDLPNTN